ncbi:MAG: 3-keto-disaccharide hydrolase, partial [Thermoanaerobaculia bacterium]
MKATLAVLWVLIALSACRDRHAGPPPPPPPPAGPETPLFNGRDLSGWVQVLDSKWVVEDGALVARQDPKGRREGESWLITEKDFVDFHLELKFRVTPGGNSGVFLRDPVPRAERLKAPDGGAPPWDAGFEANINAAEPSYPTGSIWALAKGPPGLERPGEWNELAVRVQGDRVWTWVNGKLAVEATQT